MIEANPSTSITTLSKKCNVSLSTVSSAINRDLGMTSYVRRCHDMLTAKVKAIIAERCPQILLFIKHQGAGKALVFVDKKKFTVDAEVNCKNSGVIAYDLLMSHLCFRWGILLLWWYLVLWRVMEVLWIYISLRLVWKSVQNSIWTSWRPLCYYWWSKTLGLTMWCWSKI